MSLGVGSFHVFVCVQLRTGTQTVGMRGLSTVTVGLVLPVRGDQFGRGIKCHLVKTVECGCQGGGMDVPSWNQLADPAEY